MLFNCFYHRQIDRYSYISRYKDIARQIDLYKRQKDIAEQKDIKKNLQIDTTYRNVLRKKERHKERLLDTYKKERQIDSRQ